MLRIVHLLEFCELRAETGTRLSIICDEDGSAALQDRYSRGRRLGGGGILTLAWEALGLKRAIARRSTAGCL